ncbi:hypothetical protein HK405_011724 [Cladochytrium tenue]|nr:hypothetical protein HK405_011724 [Cladochytrium tenue]
MLATSTTAAVAAGVVVAVVFAALLGVWCMCWRRRRQLPAVGRKTTASSATSLRAGEGAVDFERGESSNSLYSSGPFGSADGSVTTDTPPGVPKSRASLISNSSGGRPLWSKKSSPELPLSPPPVSTNIAVVEVKAVVEDSGGLWSSSWISIITKPKPSRRVSTSRPKSDGFKDHGKELAAADKGHDAATLCPVMEAEALPEIPSVTAFNFSEDGSIFNEVVIDAEPNKPISQGISAADCIEPIDNGLLKTATGAKEDDSVRIEDASPLQADDVIELQQQPSLLATEDSVDATMEQSASSLIGLAHEPPPSKPLARPPSPASLAEPCEEAEGSEGPPDRVDEEALQPFHDTVRPETPSPFNADSSSDGHSVHDEGLSEVLPPSGAPFDSHTGGRQDYLTDIEQDAYVRSSPTTSQDEQREGFGLAGFSLSTSEIPSLGPPVDCTSGHSASEASAEDVQTTPDFSSQWNPVAAPEPSWSEDPNNPFASAHQIDMNGSYAVQRSFNPFEQSLDQVMTSDSERRFPSNQFYDGQSRFQSSEFDGENFEYQAADHAAGQLYYSDIHQDGFMQGYNYQYADPANGGDDYNHLSLGGNPGYADDGGEYLVPSQGVLDQDARLYADWALSLPTDSPTSELAAALANPVSASALRLITSLHRARLQASRNAPIRPSPLRQLTMKASFATFASEDPSEPATANDDGDDDDNDNAAAAAAAAAPAGDGFGPDSLVHSAHVVPTEEQSAVAMVLASGSTTPSAADDSGVPLTSETPFVTVDLGAGEGIATLEKGVCREDSLAAGAE